MFGSGIRSRSGIAYMYLSPILVSSVISLAHPAIDINTNIQTVNFYYCTKRPQAVSQLPEIAETPRGI